MKRIYTRTGDKGTTGIHGGERVEKDDIRIEANGTLDELNAILGIIRSLLPQEDQWQALLFTVQKELMTVMSLVATPAALREENPNRLEVDLAALCENEMDRLMGLLKENDYFILPGGTPVSAQLQFARTVARRAERRLWTLHKKDSLPQEVLCLINRLSDLLFVMARYEMQRQEWPEERWRQFSYKRKR